MFQPSNVIEPERNKDYGGKAERKEVTRHVIMALKKGYSLKDLKPLVENFEVSSLKLHVYQNKTWICTSQ